MLRLLFANSPVAHKSIQAYNVAGGIFLFVWGPYIFFTFPEWYATISYGAIQISRNFRSIYGGIAMGIAAIALINVLALANVSSFRDPECELTCLVD